MSVAVNKTYAVAWIKQMKHVLVMVLKGVKGLRVRCRTSIEGSFVLIAIDVDCLHFACSLDSQRMTSW